MSIRPFLSVIIPAYNELANINRGVLPEILKYLQAQTYSYELILIDDGSTDGTLSALQKFAATEPTVTLFQNQHQGKASAVKTGMLAATGEWRLFTDFDQSTPLPEIEKLLAFTNSYPIIIGSREVPGAIRAQEPLHRHLMGKVFNGLVQFLAVPGIMDTQCGFKLFSATATQQLFPQLYIYGQDKIRADAFTGAFDVELLFIARRQQLAIKEVPILWQHYHSDRVSPLKDSWRMFKDICRIRWAQWQGHYETQT